jgi:hypothetical protein
MAVVLRHVNEQIPRVADVAPHVPGALSDWVAWLVERDPAARPQSAAQAWEALEEALISLLGPRWRRGSDVRLAAVPPPAEPVLGETIAPRWTPATPMKAQSKRRLRLTSVLALVAVAVAFGALGAAKLGDGSGSPVPPVLPATIPAAPIVDTAAPATTFNGVATIDGVTTSGGGTTTGGVTMTGDATSTTPSQQTSTPTQMPTAPVTPAARTQPAPTVSQQQTTTAQRTENRVAPPAPSPGSCAGDSGSDDPSDDDCSQEP